MAMLRTVAVTFFLALAATAAAAQDRQLQNLPQIEPPAPAVPTLKASATVSGEIVRIGDLISNAGVVSEIAIFRAPDLGATGVVPASRVLDAVRPHHLIGINTGDVTEVAVTRAARAITTSDVEARITRFFTGQQGLGKAENLVVQFDHDVRTRHVEPNANVELHVVRSNYEPRSGRFDVAIELVGGAGTRRQVTRYTGVLFEGAEAAVVIRPLARGEVIKRTDVAIERRRKSELHNDPVGPNDAVIGMAARQPLRAGQVLRRADMMKPELVQRNETVTLVFEVPGIRLTMRGKALESGAEGDLVSVLNVQSKRTIQGTVAGHNLVVVQSNAPPAPRTTAASLIQPAAAASRRTE
jgi:flagella basal body P-ring formation protein FlgA